MRKLLLIFITTIALLSCDNSYKKPKPDAKFNFTYKDRGTVYFENISENAETYFWNFGDGSSATSFSPVYTFKVNGNYDVTLRATGPGGESSITRTLNVVNIPTTGSVVFWSTLNKRIKIYINGSYVGTNSKYMTQGTAPSCGADGFITVTLPQGTYNFKADEDALFGSSWSGQIDVFNGNCGSMRLTN